MITSVAISYGFLGLTSAFYIGKTGFDISKLDIGLFQSLPCALLLIHSATAVILYFTEDDNVNKIYEFTKELCTWFVLPSFVMWLWLKTSYSPMISYAHPILGCIPMISYIANQENKDLADGLVVLNTVSGCIVSFILQNWFGLAASIIYGIAHGAVKVKIDSDLPQESLCNYLLIIFEYAAFTALGFAP